MNDYAAEYTEQILTDYRHNPLIEALPPIWNSSEVVNMLAHNERHHDGERQLDAHYRLRCVLRLLRYFRPLQQHVEIELLLSMSIRQGYLHRNPVPPGYKMSSLAQGREDLKAQSEHTYFKTFSPTSAGFTILGLSGVGKTSGVTNILNLYPQVIEHSSYQGLPLSLKQIVWLKLDCPRDGSVKGLCLGLFEAIDRLTGANYFAANNKRNAAIEALTITMTKAVQHYSLGVLVIDEIQRLRHTKSGGAEKMLNFLSTLTNTISIPIVLIGTTQAEPILQRNFRQVRRSSGLGSIIWDRMKNDAVWNSFVSSMWENQWTINIVSLTDELKDTLYNESQGIIAIAIKLYAMVQIRAIALRQETFTSADFQTVASESLGIVQPMLDALRSGDSKEIEAYADITPVNIEDYYLTYTAMLPPENEENASLQKQEQILLPDKAVLKLLELDVEPALAKNLVDKVMTENPEVKKVGTVARLAYQQFLSITDSVDEDGY